MDGRQEHCLKLHHSFPKPSKEALCNEELPQGLQVERERAGHSATQTPLEPVLCASRTGFVVILLQTTQLWCLSANSREDNFPFIYHYGAVRTAKQNGPVSRQLSGSLDPLLELTKRQPWKADLPQHNGHTVVLEKVQLLELRIWFVWTHPKISCASIWC